MRCKRLKRLGWLVVGYVAVYSLAYYRQFGSFPRVDTTWVDQAWQLMGPSDADE